mmetsp:Transcript_12272/g.31089  ORF Transcript_12272/g.31089 Transcript_12272/m.31089 type:complete len:265 (+) Transcript_12272:1646-2440(+)
MTLNLFCVTRCLDLGQLPVTSQTSESVLVLSVSHRPLQADEVRDVGHVFAVFLRPWSQANAANPMLLQLVAAHEREARGREIAAHGSHALLFALLLGALGAEPLDSLLHRADSFLERWPRLQLAGQILRLQVHRLILNRLLDVSGQHNPRQASERARHRGGSEALQPLREMVLLQGKLRALVVQAASPLGKVWRGNDHARNPEVAHGRHAADGAAVDDGLAPAQDPGRFLGRTHRDLLDVFLRKVCVRQQRVAVQQIDPDLHGR